MPKTIATLEFEAILTLAYAADPNLVLEFVLSTSAARPYVIEWFETSSNIDLSNSFVYFFIKNQLRIGKEVSASDGA